MIPTGVSRTSCWPCGLPEKGKIAVVGVQRSNDIGVSVKVSEISTNATGIRSRPSMNLAPCTWPLVFSFTAVSRVLDEFLRAQVSKDTGGAFTGLHGIRMRLDKGKVTEEVKVEVKSEMHSLLAGGRQCLAGSLTYIASSL